jgi:hypothetical protein
MTIEQSAADAVFFHLAIPREQLPVLVKDLVALFAEQPDLFSLKEQHELQEEIAFWGDENQAPTEDQIYERAFQLLAALGFGMVDPEHDTQESDSVPFVQTYSPFNPEREDWIFFYKPHQVDIFKKLAHCFTPGFILFVLEPYTSQRMVMWLFQDGGLSVEEGELIASH